MKNKLLIVTVALMFCIGYCPAQIGGIKNLKDKAAGAAGKIEKPESVPDVKSGENTSKMGGKTDVLPTKTKPGSPVVSNVLVAACGKSFNQVKGEILKSTDGGKTWASVYQDFNDEVRCVAYGNGLFIAFTEGKKLLLSNTGDEDTWEEVDAENPCFYSVPKTMTFGGGFFVAVGDAGTVIYSKDGSRWTLMDDFGTVLTKSHYWGVKYINNKFYVTANWNRVITLGISGDKLVVDNISANSEDVGDWIMCAVNNGSKYFAFRNSFYRSTDGITWKQYATNPAVTIQAATVFQGNIIGANWYGGIYYSADGMNWEIAGGPENGTAKAPLFREFASLGGTLIAFGDKTGFWISSDGKSWEQINNSAYEMNTIWQVAVAE
jgi:hypothetical protein